MVKEYKKIGVTTGGYRGERAILQERVIEGLDHPNFEDSRLQLTANSTQTIYLTDTNFSEGFYICLPDATTLWPNWKVCIINESSHDCNIYYYGTSLNLFKELTAGNMMTCILLDNLENSDPTGTWTTLRTVDVSSADRLYRYTSNVFNTQRIGYEVLQSEDSDEPPTQTVRISIGSILPGMALRSVYVKTAETFAPESGESVTLAVSVGTATDPDCFISNYDLTQPVSNTNFTKDLFEEILSTTVPTEIYATFTGTNFLSLIAGAVEITTEAPKLIDPTVLKNPIIQTSVPVGMIVNYPFIATATDVPVGYQWLNGSIYPNAATAIPQFVEKLTQVNNRLPGPDKLIVTESEWQSIYNNPDTYGNCGKFAWVGSGLRFPSINCFVQGLTDLTQLARTIRAGLPNITGGFRAQPDLNASAGTGYGAFIQYNPNGRVDSGTSGGGWTTGFTFDASRSSAIYGRSNTVTPLNIRYPYIISIFNRIQDSAELNLEELIEVSVNKANTNLDNLQFTNISSQVRNTFIGWNEPNYNAGIYSLSGTAPSNGWLYFRNSSAVGGPDANIYIDNTLRFTLAWTDAIMIPISVGQTYAINGGTNISCHFYPCKGV